MTSTERLGPDAPSEEGGSGSRGLRQKALGVWRGYIGSGGKDAGLGLVMEISTVLSAMVTFGSLTTKLGPIGYGYYAGVMGLVGLLSTFGGAWVSMVLLQNAVRDKQPLNWATRSATSWTTLATVVAMVGAVALGPTILPQVSLVAILAFVAAEVVGDQAVQLAASVVLVKSSFSMSSRIKLVYIWVTTFVLLAQWLTNSVTLLSVGIGQLISALIVGAGSLIVCEKHFGVPIRFGRPEVLDIQRGTLYALVLGSFALQEDADKTLLVHYHKTVDAGQYAAAYRIVQVALLPLRAAMSSTHWRFLQHDEDALGQHRKRSVKVTIPAVAYGASAVVGMVVLAPLVPHILGHKYAGTVIMIRALALFVLLRSMTLFAFNGLIGLGRNGWRTGILGFSSLVNVGINLALIPTMSWRGAVIATLVSESIFMVLTWIALLHFQRGHDRGVLARRAGLATPVGQPVPSFDREA
jgi:O-antigen/teichoic acid export membrane protein